MDRAEVEEEKSRESRERVWSLAPSPLRGPAASLSLRVRLDSQFDRPSLKGLASLGATRATQTRLYLRWIASKKSAVRATVILGPVSGCQLRGEGAAFLVVAIGGGARHEKPRPIVAMPHRSPFAPLLRALLCSSPAHEAIYMINYYPSQKETRKRNSPRRRKEEEEGKRCD